MRYSKPILGGLMLTAILGCCVLAVGLNIVYHPSDPASGTVSAGVLNVFTSLGLSPSTISEGDSWTLTATLTNGQSGVTITFKEGSVVVGTAVTNGQGTAVLTLVPSVGDHVYVAYPP